MGTVPKEAAALPDGLQMPLLGFGTWQLEHEDAHDAVLVALDAGYRHLDTATIYHNEREVGAGLTDSGLPREEVFVTTKCPPRHVGRELRTLRTSLAMLRLDQVDLWLVHWSGGERDDLDLWRAFIQAQQEGLTRAIGVSNFSLRQIDDLTNETGVMPAVNQIEWNPLLFDRGVLEGHRQRGIVLEGYSALRGGTLDHPTIQAVAGRHDRTPAQVIIRWHLQHGVVVIPKSAHEERIRSNADIGDLVLSEDEMAELDSLGSG